jgi:hypothetical protein
MITTPKELFAAIRVGMDAQGWQRATSSNDSGTPCYRSPEGLRCGIGILMVDRSLMEVCRKIQIAHDSAYDALEWRRAFERLEAYLVPRDELASFPLTN